MSGVEVLSAIASRLVETSMIGGLLALTVWVLCRLVPALPPAVRCWLWWGVALKMLLGLLPLPGVVVPLLPGREVAATSHSLDSRASVGTAVGADALQSTPAADVEPAEAARSLRSTALRSISISPLGLAAGKRHVRATLDAQPATLARAATPLRSLPWRVPLALLWLVGLTVELARAGADLLRARRVVHAAEPVTDGALLATVDTLRGRLDVPNVQLRISRAAATPQVVGVRRPVVLLPMGMYERLDGEELAMALGHELLHVRRADLLLGLVPALAARCFFFHPLARLVEREHTLAREEACDAAVVARLAPSPRAYGRLLLELSLGCGAPLRTAAAAVTHPTLQRRLHMLLTPARPFRPALVAPLLLFGMCALVPLRVTARGEASPAPPAVNASAAPAPNAGEPVPAVEPAAAGEPRTAGEPASAADPAPTVEPAVAPAAPAPLARLAMIDSRDEQVSTHRGDGKGLDAWIYFHDAKSSTMSGSSDDIAIARRLQHHGERLLWVRRGGEEWVVRDPALLSRIDELFAPVRELGHKQAELGAMQAQLGAQQAQLGAQQATFGSQQATISAQQAQLNARQAALSARQYMASDSEREGFESDQRELERQMRDLHREVEQLGEQQNELGRMQHELGGHQNELGGKQNELGDLQNELGRRMQKASAEAERAMGQLLDEAIRSGQATRVD